MTEGTTVTDDELAEQVREAKAYISRTYEEMARDRETRCANRTLQDMSDLFEASVGLAHHIHDALECLYPQYTGEQHRVAYYITERISEACFDARNEIAAFKLVHDGAREDGVKCIYGSSGLEDVPRYIDYLAELVLTSLPTTWGDFSDAELLGKLTVNVGGKFVAAKDALVFVRWMRWPGRNRERPPGAGHPVLEMKPVPPPLEPCRVGATRITRLRDIVEQREYVYTHKTEAPPAPVPQLPLKKRR